MIAGVQTAIELQKKKIFDVTLVSERDYLYLYPISIWIDHTGFASPYLNFYEEFSASENIRMLTAIRGMQPDADYEKMLFERFKLYDRRNDQVKAFSSGMKQRLRLIFAFFHRPELVILDEPIANLDNAGKEQIYNLVREERE